MASNGVILLNLGNRNAAEFQRLSVPDSYEKASGALTAGTYVTVYKWLYQGFMLAPSLCDAVDAADHINLVDRTNGGIISVYPDDTITVAGGSSPGRVPVIESLQVRANGIYTPSAGVDGFSPVSVAVPSQAEPVIESLSISANGTYTAPSGIDGYSPISVQVPSREYSIPPNSTGVFFTNADTFVNNLGFYYASSTDEQGVVDRGNSQMVYRPENYELGESYGYSSSIVGIPFTIMYVSRAAIDSNFAIWNYVIIPAVECYAFKVTGLNTVLESYHAYGGEPIGVRQSGENVRDNGWLFLRAV